MLDNRGNVRDANVTWVRTIVRGPDPKCGYLVQPDFPVRMPLDGPLLPADWTAEINYLANSEGSMTMSLSDGRETKVPCIPDSTASSCDCPAPVTPSTSRQHRCAVRLHRVRARRIPGTDLMPRWTHD